MNNEMATDNMSNEEAIEVLKGIVFGGFDRTTPKEREALDFAIKILEERRQGKWVISKLGNNFYDVSCPFCNARPTKSEYGYYLLNNYCHNCGAEMRGEEE